MKSQDWMDAESYRNKLLAIFMEMCLQHGLSSSAAGDKLIITLPTVDEMSVWPEEKKRKVFDESTWGNIDIFGNKVPDDTDLPTVLPPANYTLEEGQPPVGEDEE